MRGSRPTLKPCGTQAAYQRHRYHGEAPCHRCVVANRMYQREYRRRYFAKHTPKITESIVDLLSAELRWMTRSVIVDLIVERHPHFTRESVERTIARLRASGRLEVRTDPRDPLGQRFEYFCDEWAVA